MTEHDRTTMTPTSYAASSEIVPDDVIQKIFSGKNFGEEINSSITEQRLFLARACQKTSNGFWNGHTIFRIMVDLELVHDTKKATLTDKGRTFVECTLFSV